MFCSSQVFNTFQKKKDYLIAVDSDGCMFDVMELKHKECFIPNVIQYWGLQSISKYVRETAEFINLYSRDRGVNRFIAYIKMLDLLDRREEVQRRNIKVPKMEGVKKWISNAAVLSNDALYKEAEKTGDADLLKAYAWSKASNESIKNMVHGVMPFPLAKESLEKAAQLADIVVVSSASADALEREWNEAGVGKCCSFMAGQEMGSKKYCLGQLKDMGYHRQNILMIGDAPGDQQAAKENDVLFYPIIPGTEENSWEKFYNEAFEYFIGGTYEGMYQKSLEASFLNCLSHTPPWEE